MAYNNQFAKSYGHGGFFRRNIEDDQLSPPNAEEIKKSAKKPLSPQPERESEQLLRSATPHRDFEGNTIEAEGDIVKQLHKKMK